MWNIIKAQNYQTRSDNAVIYGSLVCLLLLFTGFMGETSLSDMTGSLYLVSVSKTLPMVLAVITLILTTRICGWDIADKTINYEVMAGHSRSEVYWGRVITSMLWGMIAGMIIIFVPMIIFTALHGWGLNMSLQGALTRILLLLFPVLRLICEFALLTFLLKNCYVAMIIGFVLYDAVNIMIMIMEEVSDFKLTVQLAAANINSLLDFGNNTFEYINGEDILVYDTVLDASFAVQSVTVSLLVGAVCLILGYVYFKKNDML